MLQLSLMDVHQLKVFVAVFKNKSFSKASEELHLTQPTVSDHIRALEEELNCRLFDRLGRKIIPTKEAEMLSNRAIEIIEKLDSVKDFLGQFKKEVTGHLIIGASTIPGTYILPHITASFRKLHPSLLFEIQVSDSRGIIKRISEHELLIGIVGSKLGSSQVQYAPFMDDELIAISSPSIPKSNNVTIKELISLPMLVREEGSGTRREFEKILEASGISVDKLDIAGVFGSTDAIKQAVKEGMGVSILSRRAVLDELKCKILKEIRVRDVQMKRSFFIVTHRKRTLPHQYKVFLDYLITQKEPS
ncbi:MAG: selenium metabolism-associated LysR family transcriptional regulator [Nitrospirae bacterium]|nr:selenium metabolism-associated LysR family transcriptional regulator [Nitrospirota bacterium]